MKTETGHISVHTENILPIIKKWLYSDRDIFVREMISNGCDAVGKLKHLANIGQTELKEEENFYVRVLVDKEKKTITFQDNGLGMTKAEIEEYINQVAFSGAEAFLKNYEGQGSSEQQIIGHFGLGFYSAFMVAERVTIETLSYRQDAQAVSWCSDGGTEYTLSASDRKERGTSIVLQIAAGEEDFLEEFQLQSVIKKYCSFLPVPIYFGEETEEALNDTKPLWLRDPMTCSDEDYKNFYHQVFYDGNDPLFWVHLNVDYPFDLKGILYFPKLKHELDTLEGQVKLYNNQVYVADNIKEVIPEFLLLLKGAIDCKDLPLNVSRSFLQNDQNVMKISRHITKKVADKLVELFKKDREAFNRYWEDINPFVKYGCMRDEKFYEKVKDLLLFKDIHQKTQTWQEFIADSGDKKTIYYVTDERQQARYIKLFQENDLNAMIMPSTIDLHFIQFLEMKQEGYTFKGIDSEIAEALRTNGEKNESLAEKIKALFAGILVQGELELQTEHMKDKNIPGIMIKDETDRRMREMSAAFGGVLPQGKEKEVLVLNLDSVLLADLLQMQEEGRDEKVLKLLVEQVYDLALLGQGNLNEKTMNGFLERSNLLMSRLAEKA